jgi:hypothetical protein
MLVALSNVLWLALLFMIAATSLSTTMCVNLVIACHK